MASPELRQLQRQKGLRWSVGDNVDYHLWIENNQLLTDASFVSGGLSPYIDVTAYGASTLSLDNTAAFQAALNVAAGTGANGTQAEVFVPLGTYWIKSPLYNPNKVVIRGESGFGTIIKADPSFVGSFMVYGGLNDGAAIFNNRVEDLTLDCNNVAGLGGYFSNQLNELCGLKRVSVFHYMTRGIDIEAGSGITGGYNWLLEDINLNASASAVGSYGVYLLGTGGSLGYGQINRCTVVPNGGAAIQTAGIYVHGAAGGGVDEMGAFCFDVHVENHTDGVHFDTQSQGFVKGLTVSGGTVNGATIDATRPVTIENVRTTGGNCIVDNRNSVTIPAFWWGFYATAGSAAGGSSQFEQIALSAPASRIIPGATSLSLRNNANTLDNFTMTDAGAATLNGTLSLAGKAVVGGSTLFTLTPGAHTAVVAEVIDVLFAAHTMTITGNYATQRFIEVAAPVISAATALTVTTGITFDIAGAPTATGLGPAAITTPLAFRVASGAVLFAGSSALSNPTLYVNGTWVTGGSSSTTMPHVLIASAAAAGTWSTSGTGLGVSAPNGFAGYLADFQVNSTSRFRFDNAGNLTANTASAIALFNKVTAGALLLTVASAVGAAGLRLPHGAAPTSPVDGDMWTTTTGLFVRINGSTVGPLS